MMVVLIPKAISIAESFEVSRQFWAYLVQQNKVCTENFIKSIPHLSFVWGEKMSNYLKTRFEVLQANPLLNRWFSVQISIN
jgi:malate dehydrogenase (quinone)